jgi:hypothetical protein
MSSANVFCELVRRLLACSCGRAAAMTEAIHYIPQVSIGLQKDLMWHTETVSNRRLEKLWHSHWVSESALL